MPELNANSMRVLIFKDCDRKGDKSLVFDSDAVQFMVLNINFRGSFHQAEMIYYESCSSICILKSIA